IERERKDRSAGSGRCLRELPPRGRRRGKPEAQLRIEARDLVDEAPGDTDLADGNRMDPNSAAKIRIRRPPQPSPQITEPALSGERTGQRERKVDEQTEDRKNAIEEQLREIIGASGAGSTIGAPRAPESRSDSEARPRLSALAFGRSTL